MATKGRLSHIEWGKETTWGTAVSSAKSVPLITSGLKETSDWAEPPDLYHGAGGVGSRLYELSRDVGGTFEVLPSYTVLGYLLEAALGTPGSSGAGPYDHTFSLSDPGSLPALTLRLRHGNSAYLSTFAGCMINQLTFRWQARQYGRLTIDVIGEDLTAPASGSPLTVATPALIMPQHAGTFGWNSGSYTTLTEFTLRLNNGLTRAPALGTQKTQQPFPSGRRQIELTAKARMTEAQLAAFVTARQSGTQSDATLTLTGSGNHALAITGQNAQVLEEDISINSFGDLDVPIRWKCLDDGSDKGLTIVLSNDEANYYD